MLQLENFVKQNREKFDDEEPIAGHLERFQTMVKPKTQTLQMRFYPIAKVAAVLVLVVLSSLWVYDQFAQATYKESVNRPLSGVSGEMAEAEMFLTSTIDRKYWLIRNQGQEGRRISEQIMKIEFREMDSLLNVLAKEYKAKPNDSRIVDAMIIHYQTKIGILDRILNDLKSMQKQKSLRHEKIEL
jgi:hypothetical protein